MKTIYDATRALLYPLDKDCAASVAFARGINSYRPRLRQALVKFEQVNRGHRHLLSTPALTLAYAAHREGPYADQSYRTMRANLRDSVYALATAVIEGAPHAQTPALKVLLAAQDDSGWLSHFINGELYQLGLKNKKIGLHGSFYLMLSIDIRDAQVSLKATVHDKETQASATRTLQPISRQATSLGNLVPLLHETQAALQSLVKDVTAWPEFANRDQVIASYED